MKQVAILAGLAASMAAANAHLPHHHHHENARRDADAVVTTWDITTQWDYVTVTAGQSQPSNPPVGGPAKDAVKPANNVNADAVKQASPSSYDPQAAQNSAIAYQSSIDAVQASINAHQMSINNAGPTGAPVPTAPTQAQAQPSTPAATPTPQTGGSTGGSIVVGKGYQGMGTYYGAEGGYGSCGSLLSDDGHTIALAESLMGQNKVYCGRTVQLTVGSGQAYNVTVADSCPGCDDDPLGHIDIVQGFAHQIDPNIDTSGHVELTWELMP